MATILLGSLVLGVILFIASFVWVRQQVQEIINAELGKFTLRYQKREECIESCAFSEDARCLRHCKDLHRLYDTQVAPWLP